MSDSVTPHAYCVEYFYAKPGYRDQLVEALLKLVETVRAEPGCLQYDLIQDIQNSNLIILLVKFENQESMRLHEQQAYIQQFAENEMKKYCDKFIYNDALEIERVKF